VSEQALIRASGTEVSDGVGRASVNSERSFGQWFAAARLPGTAETQSAEGADAAEQVHRRRTRAACFADGPVLSAPCIRGCACRHPCRRYQLSGTGGSCETAGGKWTASKYV